MVECGGGSANDCHADKYEIISQSWPRTKVPTNIANAHVSGRCVLRRRSMTSGKTLRGIRGVRGHAATTPRGRPPSSTPPAHAAQLTSDEDDWDHANEARDAPGECAAPHGTALDSDDVLAAAGVASVAAVVGALAALGTSGIVKRLEARKARKQAQVLAEARPPPPTPQRFRFDAFISYRRNDFKVADATDLRLQLAGLRTFKVHRRRLHCVAPLLCGCISAAAASRASKEHARTPPQRANKPPHALS